MRRSPDPAGRSGAPGRSVLVDARGIDASGIGRFLREVLGRLLLDPRFSRVVLLGSVERLRVHLSALEPVSEVTLVEFDHPYYSPRAQLDWLRLVRLPRLRADAAFFPHYDVPVLELPRRSVVTVQDLIHFRVPEAFPRAKRVAAGFLLRRGVEQADVVLVTSAATARDLTGRIPSVAGKIRTVPLGVGEFFRPAGVTDHPEEPVAEPPYLLCVGNLKPHKNHVAAVEALSRLSPGRPDLKLVLAGKPFDGFDRVIGRVAELGLTDRVVHLREPTDAQLRSLYRGCAVLLFPSLYEGFGLPVLEAMACGAPVVATTRASVPEVAGDAALLVDPLDHAGMASAVARLLDDVRFREELVARGLSRAAEFSWSDTASRVADLLHRVAGGEEASAGASGGPAGEAGAARGGSRGAGMRAKTGVGSGSTQGGAEPC